MYIYNIDKALYMNDYGGEFVFQSMYLDNLGWCVRVSTLERGQ